MNFKELTNEFNKIVPNNCAEYIAYSAHREIVQIDCHKVLTPHDYIAEFGRNNVSNLDILNLMKEVDKTTKTTVYLYAIEVTPYNSYNKYVRLSHDKTPGCVLDNSMLTMNSKSLAERLLNKVKKYAVKPVVKKILNEIEEKKRQKITKEYAKLFNINKDSVTAYTNGVSITIPRDLNNPTSEEINVEYDIKKGLYEVRTPEVTKSQLDKILDIIRNG